MCFQNEQDEGHYRWGSCGCDYNALEGRLQIHIKQGSQGRDRRDKSSFPRSRSTGLAWVFHDADRLAAIRSADNGCRELFLFSCLKRFIATLYPNSKARLLSFRHQRKRGSNTQKPRRASFFDSSTDKSKARLSAPGVLKKVRPMKPFPIWAWNCHTTTSISVTSTTVSTYFFTGR